MNAPAFIRHCPRAPNAAQLFGDGQAGLQSVLVETGAKISAAEPGVTPALQRPEVPLRFHRIGVELRVFVRFGSDDAAVPGVARRIERHEQRCFGG